MKYLTIYIVFFIYLTQISISVEANVLEPSPNDWLIKRKMWLAMEHNNTDIIDDFNPIKLVIISHTVSSECNSFQACAAELRNLQSFFLNVYGYDIPYNFIIGNDGRVYEGRGWNKVGAHTFSYSRCTMGLAFVGDYREGIPHFSKVTTLQQLSAHKLFLEGVKLGYLRPDFDVLGAKDLQSTISPGSNLYKAIKNWPNYDHENRYKNRSCEEIYGLVRPVKGYKTREMWGAKNYSDPEVHVEESLRLVIVTDTTSTRCNRFLTCAAEIRQLQSYYHSNFHYDIPYNFLIGSDGRVYEGRGWRVAGDHTKGYNNCSLGLAFIGDYTEDWPGTTRVRDIQIQRAQLLFEEGVKLGHLSSDFHVLAAKDLVKTLKPGNNLYREIRGMANYDHENRYKNLTCEEIKSL